MHKRNKGKSKKPKNPQPQSSPKVAIPAEVEPAAPGTAEDIPDTNTEETRVPEVQAKVVTSAPVETSQEIPSTDKAPEKPKRNRSKRNKNKNDPEVPDAEVTPSVEIKLPEKEVELNKTTTKITDNVIAESIPEQESSQPEEPPVTTSRKKNNKKNKNKNAESQQITLTNQPSEIENEKKANIEVEVKRQKEAELAKANTQVKAEKDQKLDTSDNAPPTTSRKKKGENKNKSQSNTSDNTNKPADEKTDSPNKQPESAVNVLLAEKSEKNDCQIKSKVQSDVKVALDTSSSPNLQKLANLVTPDLEPITDLGFEYEDLADKPLSKSARKKAKKNQNKNQGLSQVTQVLGDLTNKDEDSIAPHKVDNSNSGQDVKKLSSKDMTNEAINESNTSCPIKLDVLKHSKKEEQKESDYLDEIKQSLDRSLEELISIEKEHLDKIETQSHSKPSNIEPSVEHVRNNLMKTHNKQEKPETTEKTPVADNSQIKDIPNETFKGSTGHLKVESEESNTCSGNKTVMLEPSANEGIKQVQPEKVDSITISETSKDSTPKITDQTCEKLGDVNIYVETQETITKANSSEESIKTETDIHSCPLLQNLGLEKIDESAKLVKAGKKNETVQKKNEKLSGGEVTNEVPEHIPQKQGKNNNKSKNNKQAQISNCKDTPVQILKTEKDKINLSSHPHEDTVADLLKEDDQEKNIEQIKDMQNKSSKGNVENNTSVDVANTANIHVPPLEKIKEKQISDSNINDSKTIIFKEKIPEEVEYKSKPVPTLPEKLEATTEIELLDDLEIIPELIPISVLEIRNENQRLDTILNVDKSENVKDMLRECPALQDAQQSAPKQDKGKGQSKKGNKRPHPQSPKPTDVVKQSTTIEKDILNLLQETDSIKSEPVAAKHDDIDAAFEMIAQGVIKKDGLKDKSQPSTVQCANQKGPADNIKPLQAEKKKGNRSKNLEGPPDIPVISNKDDYKKEKNKKEKNKCKDSATSAPSSNGGPSQKDGFASEGDDEEFIYKYSFRKVFMANACHVCKAELKSHRIICSYCNLVSYCGQKHKDEDWPQHQALCFAISTIVHLKGIKFVYSDAKSVGGQEYRLLRMQTIVSCEKILKRKLSPCEQEILLYPRMCLDVACREWRSAILKDCDVCGQVSYCKENPSHLMEDHKKWCDSYKLYYKLVAHQQREGRVEPRLPTKIISDTAFQLPANTADLVRELYEGKLELDDVHYAALTQLATAPLTALYGYQEYLKKNPDLPKDDSSFTIHVVGAELQFEADMLSKWEVFFLHLHPSTVDLKVVFVGPELNPSKLPLEILSKIRLCKECRQAKRNMTFEFQDGLLYHNFATSEKFSTPNLVCAFNPGLHRTTGYGGLDTWPDTIKAILALGCPVCVTSYTSYELPRDLARLQECWPQVRLQTAPQLNPYASIRPDRNFISDDEMPLIFKNYYLMVVTG